MNTFTPYFLFALAMLSIRALKASVKFTQLKPRLRKKDILALSTNLVNFLFFFVIIRYTSLLLFRLNMTNRFIQILIGILLFYMLQRAFQIPKLKPYRWVLAPPVALLITLDLLGSPGNLRIFMLWFLIYFGVFLALRSAVLSLDGLMFDREVRIPDLKPGMVAAEQIICVEEEGGRRYEKLPFSFSNPLNPKVVVAPLPEGLSEESVEMLKKLSQQGYFKHFGDTLKIQAPLRFAPIITLGVLITVVCRGPFYRLLL